MYIDQLNGGNMDLRLHNFEERMVDILGNEIIFET